MINRKEILWSVLTKYDGVSEFNSFCDSVSKFIQDKQDGSDIINIFKSLTKIDKSDKEKIDNVIGNDIDFFLFSL
jgi:hypothetical protein